MVVADTGLPGSPVRRPRWTLARDCISPGARFRACVFRAGHFMDIQQHSRVWPRTGMAGYFSRDAPGRSACPVPGSFCIAFLEIVFGPGIVLSWRTCVCDTLDDFGMGARLDIYRLSVAVDGTRTSFKPVAGRCADPGQLRRIMGSGAHGLPGCRTGFRASPEKTRFPLRYWCLQPC